MASRYRGESAFTLTLRGLDFIDCFDVTNMTIKLSRFYNLPCGLSPKTLAGLGF